MKLPKLLIEGRSTVVWIDKKDDCLGSFAADDDSFQWIV
jgi:hypothetical protein